MKTTITTTKKILVILILFCSMGIVKAQDIITFKNGDEANVKIEEVSENEVKYKRADNPGGPLYTVSKSDIFMVKYSNGTKEIMGQATSTVGTIETINMVPVKKNPGIEKELHFGGPRIGFTYLQVGGTSAEYLTDRGKQPFITQFGWQFEKRIFTMDNNGAQGLVEFIPMIGGMEQGLLLPSASGLIGFRTGGKRGHEFAIGPNLSLSGLGIVIAAGTSFKVGNVYFPLNLAFVPSVAKSHNTHNYTTGTNQKATTNTGFRLSLVVGFNTMKR